MLWTDMIASFIFICYNKYVFFKTVKIFNVFQMNVMGNAETSE